MSFFKPNIKNKKKLRSKQVALINKDIKNTLNYSC